MNPPPIQLRSSRRADSEPEMPAPEDMLPYTPLGELTVADMEAEQVWEQLELRAEGICRVVKEVGSGDAPDEDEDEREHDEFGSGSDDEMTAEEWERMMEEEYDGASGSEDEDDDEEDGEIRWNSDEEMEMGSDLGSDLGSEGSDVEGEDDEDDDDDEASGSDVEMDDASDAGSAGSDDRYAPGPSKPRTLHPVLDDQFFSIDEFNRVTEELEAGRVTSGALGGDEDEDAELDDIGQMFLEEGDDDAGESSEAEPCKQGIQLPWLQLAQRTLLTRQKSCTATSLPRPSACPMPRAARRTRPRRSGPRRARSCSTRRRRRRPASPRSRSATSWSASREICSTTATTTTRTPWRVSQEPPRVEGPGRCLVLFLCLPYIAEC
jgi:U3 small nucleolar RNA-associated protein MPP10